MKDYLGVSAVDDVNDFLKLYAKATPEFLKLAIENVEVKRGIVISKKLSFLENYTRNYENLKIIIDKYRGRDGR